MNQRIILMRHGESIKNIENKQGGPGKSLTTLGRQQVFSGIKLIKDYRVHPKSIYHSNRTQSNETAMMISNKLQIAMKSDSRLDPLDLDLISGLSNTEAKTKYPDVFKKMEMWRRGEIEIAELNLPGGEDIELFWNRGIGFIRDIECSEETVIVVGTRSILILLMGILLGRSIKLGGGYKSICIPTGGIFTFCHCPDSGFIVDKSLTSFSLKYEK